MIMPAPTVPLVRRSMTMKAPVVRFCSYPSRAMGASRLTLTLAISFSCRLLPAVSSRVFTSTLWAMLGMEPGT
ncbi:hypothetical protein D3C84_972900 [compost metagenome]